LVYSILKLGGIFLFLKYQNSWISKLYLRVGYLEQN